jgi:site-specific recombinase XerD
VKIIEYLRTRGDQDRSGIRRKALSRFYRWAKSEKLTLMNPVEKIPVPKLARSLLVCSDHQIRQIESFVKNPESDAEYALILTLVLYWGITTLELTLSTIDIRDGQNLWISVHRKHLGRWRKSHNRDQVLKLPMTPSWLAALQKRYIQLWRERFEQSKKSFPLQPLILSRSARCRTNRLLHNHSILDLFYEASLAATGQRIPPNVVRRTSGHIHTNHGDASRLTKLGWSKSTATDFSFLPRNYFSPAKK